MLDMIRAEEARKLVAASEPDRDMAANDTLSDDAMDWAFQNAIGRTEMRIKTYARFGRTQARVKFAPGATDCAGDGNSFYNDLVGNSNVIVADAIADIIYGRDQDVISPLQRSRLLNTYSTRLAKFVRDVERLGYNVTVGEGAGQGGHDDTDDSTIIISWA